MKRTAELEASTRKNPVTPGEALPASELLGDMLLELGRYEEALAAYRTALERSMNRLNALHGGVRLFPCLRPPYIPGGMNPNQGDDCENGDLHKAGPGHGGSCEGRR